MLLLLRLIGMLVAGVVGWQLGVVLASYSENAPAAGEALRYVLILALAAGALGLIVTPYATVVPLRRLWVTSRSVAASDLLGAVAGLVVGLSIAALAAFPIALLPDPLGQWLPAVVALLLAWLGLAIGAQRKDEVASALRATWSDARPDGGLKGAALLDTSAIIDGRILEIRRCGFIGGDLVVPRFVLEELQLVADSADASKRVRGRRGLEILERLQRDVPLEISDADFLDLRGVDSKLIRLARHRRAAIVTTDYNLNRVASLQGVPVLNINDLAQALRSVVVPGEEIPLEIAQEGRERGQGIGYLDDGTMIVVEGGRRFVGQKTEVEITRVLPTAGGRIVFARLKSLGEEASEGVPSPDRERVRVLRSVSGGGHD
jgi:uncharacterized protein YacL